MGKNEEDEEAFYKEIEAAGYKGVWQLPEGELRNQVYKSWERIFDLDWYVEKWTEPRGEKSIQATFWEMRMDMVRDITHFGKRYIEE